MKISCVIPTYNEASRIMGVLDAVSKSDLVDEVLVMDDCSTDDTASVISKYPKVKYIKSPINQGKSRTVCEGIRISTGDIIFFLDADLLGLTVENIKDLLTPIILGEVDMTISLRDTYPLKDKVSPKVGLDHLSGERAFRKELITPHIGEIYNLTGFGLETFINKVIVKNKYSIKIVKWKNVYSPLKSYKYNIDGYFVNFVDYIKMWRSVLKVVSLFEVIKNIIEMKKLIKYDIPTISLVIPAYNEEKYIEQCLEKVILLSKNKFLEIIVINNASTDKTKEVAEKFSEVKVIDEEKKGVVHARQKGFLESKGDIIAYLDADSYFMEGWPDMIINEFKKNDSLACLSGICKYHDTQGWQNVLIWIYWNIFAMPTYWILGYMMISGNFTIRRDVLTKMNGFDTTIKFYGDDTNTARRASLFGKAKFRKDFFIYTSGRRLSSHGLLRVGFLYVINFLSEVFLHKPYTKEYTDCR